MDSLTRIINEAEMIIKGYDLTAVERELGIEFLPPWFFQGLVDDE